MSEDQSGQKSVSLGDAMDFVRSAIEHGKFEDAANILNQILALKPDFAEAVNYLAGVRYHQHQFDEAVELTMQAVKLEPDNAAIRNNLATMYLETGDLEEAVKTYREAVHLDPTQPEPIVNLAWMLMAFKNTEEAEVLLKKAIELNPDSAIAHQRYSQLLFSLDRIKEALDHGYEVLRHTPAAKRSVTLIMHATLRLEGPEAARKVLEEALAIDPDNVEAKHLIGSLSEDDTPDRASDEYVEHTFDRFADSFDEKLQKLHYRAPEIIGDRLDTLREGKPEASMTILDAGCGTGWSGQRLRKHAAVLTGIDLSNGMLRKAEIRGGYDELVQAELVEFIEGKPNTYNAIVSADTICYFGDISGFCSAAAKSVLAGGLVIFTVEETASDSKSGFVLTPSGRYQHDASYVRSELEKAGFEILIEDREVLRQENLEDVNGLVYVARQPAPKVAG